MPDEILTRRGYVLAETKDFYGIWRAGAEGEPLERFPLTLEGFEDAEERLRDLVRLKRERRGFTAALLWRIVVFGGSLWIAAGLAVSALSVYSSSFPSSFVPATVFQAAFFADYWAQRIAIGGLVMLSALMLVRMERRAREEGLGTLRSFLRVRDQPEPSPRTWEVVLRWTLVVGLVAWILSAVATEGLFLEPLSFSLGESVQQRFSSGYVVSRLVEAFAFRVWVSALVLLAVRWGRRWTQPEETGPEELISAR